MSDENQIRGLIEYNEKLNKIIIESLQDALLYLMERNDFNKITITELCQKAGVSRMAFYTNFKTKDALLESIVLKLNGKLISKIGSPFRSYVDINWYINLFNATKNDYDILFLIFKSGFKYKYISIINALVLENPNLTNANRCSRLMWAGGIVNVMIDWVESGMSTPLVDVANYCFNSFSYIFQTAFIADYLIFLG